jgi:L-aspartate oxidase
VLAAGGVGKIYLYTSNPDIASGDGIAWISRSVKVANMEFMQFHPHVFFTPWQQKFSNIRGCKGEGGYF